MDLRNAASTSGWPICLCLGLFLTAAICQIPDDEDPCDSDDAILVPDDSKCLLLAPEAQTWSKAQAYCERRAGNLYRISQVRGSNPSPSQAKFHCSSLLLCTHLAGLSPGPCKGGEKSNGKLPQNTVCQEQSEPYSWFTDAWNKHHRGVSGTEDSESALGSKTHLKAGSSPVIGALA
ncbi:hypothetical protein PoB_006426900 [Plakobranchus ocellatus]|uniref:C-type lectin domain-containing protein n=1 Tax=Plakobranchus ocellatus TaxID=259542 RepID=A0AAV4D0N1_9GAST|nr:hypothetical protein PoB_006426900 [Plakobranchus ocellatus]